VDKGQKVICPQCKKREMAVTHSFKAGDSASTQTLNCEGCDCVATVVAEIVAVNPGYGEGALALSRQLQRKTPHSGALNGTWKYARDGD
jgi:hypothetical protein